jgi:hypothetical protein
MTEPTVTEYGCRLCNRHHVRELEPSLYAEHLVFQAKHHEPRERKARAGEIFALAMQEDARG